MSMLDRQVKIPAKANRKIELKAYPGHFATNHSHINYYLDITPIKCRHTEAQRKNLCGNINIRKR